MDAIDDGLSIEYSPCLDGDPDPGEVVWTWVSYEEDPSQGKDRPVVIIGRRGAHLLAVALTSKRHDNEAQVEVGRGPWDRDGRVSYAKVERLLDVDPSAVRREGAVLERQHFDDVVAGVRRTHRGR
jgi:mRNA-degrading endonuclease toxin of MazEF toxin-antitoxin module